MITLPSLYPHQEAQVGDARSELARNGSAIIHGVPGSGKTREAKYILGCAMNREKTDKQSGKVLFCVYGRPLVDNASNSFSESPELPHGVLMSDRETAYAHRVQVGSIDTLNRWMFQDETYTSDMTFDLVIYDECHDHLPKLATFLDGHAKRREALGLNKTYVLGLSGTPEAAGLADHFRAIVSGKPSKWLIENGYMSAFEYFAATPGKLGLLVKSGDRFTETSEAAAMECLQGELVRDWLKYAQGGATVGFFSRVSQSKQAMARLTKEGVKAVHIDATTPDEKRWEIFQQLNEGDVDYVCNVGIMNRGTDVPRISCVQLCCADNSVKRYLQKVTRGSRVHPEVEPICRVIDHGGNVKRLNPYSFVTEEYPWSLDRSTRDTQEASVKPVVECPVCQRQYRGGKCTCGYEPTREQMKFQGLEFDNAELVEVSPHGATKPKSTMTPEKLFRDILFKMGRSGKTWRQACGVFGMEARKEFGCYVDVPARFTVAGTEYKSLPKGDPQGSRRVSALYDFV